jgi:hypothetical protein
MVGGAQSGATAVLAVSEFVNREVRERGRSTGAAADAAHRHDAEPDRGAKTVVWRSRQPPFDASNPRPDPHHLHGRESLVQGPAVLSGDARDAGAGDPGAKFHLSICAQGADQTEWMLRRLEPRLAGVKRASMATTRRTFPGCSGGQDLGVVPSVWWDNAPQTVFEFLRVLGACSRSGEYRGHSGLSQVTARTGCSSAPTTRTTLAMHLRRIAALSPPCSRTMRHRVSRPKDIDEHARELISVYSDCARARGRLLAPVVESHALARRVQPGAIS